MIKIFNLELLQRIKKNFKEKGAITVVWLSFEFIYYKLIKSRTTFNFRGEEYHYFYHWYNTTWKNERAVEIPIIMKIITSYKGKTILEIGNVLSHYFSFDHDIVDKYEKYDGVINQDVVDFKPSNKYDLIISVSTLEHVGWNEEPLEPRKILSALENLIDNALVCGGQIIVSLPLGENPEMDKLLKNGEIPFIEEYYLKRISDENNWIEVNQNEIHNFKYNSNLNCPELLVVGVIKHS